ncbi:MAG: Na+/H+ antiporter subunit E [Candidatus Omnitrophota bacterium]
MIGRIFLFGVCYAIWLILSWPIDRQSLILGAPAALLVYFLTKDFFSGESLSKRSPLRFIWLVPYAALFFWECLKANLDVAARVLQPDLPIRPGTIRIKTRLKTDVGLTFLANSLSLTPGNTTLDVDREKGFIYIHCLSLKGASAQFNGHLAIAEKFEKVLTRIFE